MKTKKDSQIWGVFTRPIALFTVGSALLLSTSLAFGQAVNPQPDTNKDEVVQMEKYNVTGSYIPYAADAPAVPIRTIDRTNIQSSGIGGNLLDLLRMQAPQFVGNANMGSNNSNISSNWTNGGSMLSLRSEPTLVLINGRRAAYAPVGAVTGFTFVDVNAIPMSAVDRIEILSDGASAIYGSDAVSGVVNVILRKDYEGFEVGGRYKMATSSGNWKEYSAYVTGGVRSGKTSITVSLQYLKDEPIYQKDRPFSADMSGMTMSVPGAVTYYGAGDPEWYLAVPGRVPDAGTSMTPQQLVDAGYYTGPYWNYEFTEALNLAPYVTLLASNKKTSGVIMFEHDLKPNLQFFGDVLLSQFETYSQLAAQPISFMPPYGNVTEADGTVVRLYANHVTEDGTATVDHPQNPFDDEVGPRNRFVAHPRGYKTVNKSMRFLGGLRGKINENWSWETAINYNHINQWQDQTGVIDRGLLVKAVNSGLINLFAAEQAPGAFEQSGIFGKAWQENISSLATFDFRVNGKIIDLPAGPLLFASGIEYRHEILKGNSDEGSHIIHDLDDDYNGMPEKWDGALGGDPFRGSRRVVAGFLQVRVPVTAPAQKIPFAHTFEIDAALRYENYSDTSNPLVPKVLLRYLPFDNQFAIRASYAESFNAPALWDLTGPGGVGFTSPLRNVARYGGGMMGGNYDQAVQADRSNPDLKPEKSKTYNAGVVFSPKKIKGLEVEASYFRIKRTSLIGVEFSTKDIIEDVELRGADSKYAKNIHIGSFGGTPITAPGQISAAWDANAGSFSNLYVVMVNENLSESTMQDGVDFSARYGFATKSYGKFRFELVGMWYRKIDSIGMDALGVDNLVGTTSSGFGLFGTYPRWQTNLTARWEYSDLDVTLFGRYIPAVRDVDYVEPVDRFVSFDASVGYTFRKGVLKGLTARVGCNNVFNRMPPVAWTWDDCFADIGTYGAHGRVVYVDVSFKF